MVFLNVSILLMTSGDRPDRSRVKLRVQHELTGTCELPMLGLESVFTGQLENINSVLIALITEIAIYVQFERHHIKDEVLKIE